MQGPRAAGDKRYSFSEFRVVLPLSIPLTQFTVISVLVFLFLGTSCNFEVDGLASLCEKER